MPNVFAYGTLMFPEVAKPLAKIEADGEPLTVPGFRRFEATTRSWGNYPAIVADSNSSVDGLLFRDLTNDQLEAFDRFEDIETEFYLRQQVEIEFQGNSLSIFLYVCGPGLKRRLLEPLNKAWSPELFRRFELSRYVERVVKPHLE